MALRAFEGAHHLVEDVLKALALLGRDDAAVHAREHALELGRLGPVGGRVLEPDLRRIEEEVEFLLRIVPDLFVEVEEAAPGVALPAPEPPAEGGEVDGVLVVETLVEVHELVDVEVVHLAQAVAARAFAGRVVEREGVRIADERFAHARKEQPQQRIDVRVGANRRARVGGRLLLVDHDGHGQVLDALHVGPSVLGQELLHERRKGLVELAARLGRHCVEAQGGLAGAGDPREDGDLLLGYFERDVLQIVLKRVDDIYSVHFYLSFAVNFRVDYTTEEGGRREQMRANPPQRGLF